MRFYEEYTRTHHYKYLPAFSKFLLEHELDAFSREQVRLSYEINIPILKLLKHLSEEQLIAFTRESMVEFLSYLAQNKAKELIAISLERWKSDRLEIIGKFELMAEDITLISYVRSKAFRNFIPLFTRDIDVIQELTDELDSFFTGSTTAATNTYIDLLKDQIARHETNLLEAQHIAHIGSFEMDLSTQKTQSSPEVYAIFEIKAGTGMNEFMNFIHPEDKPKVEKALSQAMETGHYESEYRFIINNKTKYIWSKGVVLFEDKKPVKFIGTIQDITDRKISEQQLVDKTIALERSNESLQQFAYVASHDLKEPIRKIGTYSDMILTKESNLSETSFNNLKKIHHSALHMRGMIDDILTYSTLTQWEEKKKVNLGGIIKEVIEVLENSINEKGATINFDHLPDAVVIASQFRQLFQNLISNSIKFSKKETPLVINISHQWLSKVKDRNISHSNKYLKIEVTDNGIGFNQEFAEKIFGMFSRLHGKSEYEGSGIGLSIARKIMDNHGGDIYATSEPGNGATFTIIIPQ